MRRRAKKKRKPSKCLPPPLRDVTKGLLGCDTCHSPPDLRRDPPGGLRRAAKVKVFKGREAGREENEEEEAEEEKWLTREGQEESYLSSTSCTTLEDAEAAYALWEICPCTSVQISRQRDSRGGRAAAATSEPISLRIGRCWSTNVASVIFKGTIYANCVTCLSLASEKGNGEKEEVLYYAVFVISMRQRVITTL